MRNYARNYHRQQERKKKMTRIIFCGNCQKLNIGDNWITISPVHLAGLIKDRKNTVTKTTCPVCKKRKRLSELEEASKSCGVCGIE